MSRAVCGLSFKQTNVRRGRTGLQHVTDDLQHDKCSKQRLGSKMTAVLG